MINEKSARGPLNFRYIFSSKSEAELHVDGGVLKRKVLRLVRLSIKESLAQELFQDDLV